MQVAEILKGKGDQVATIRPEDSVSEAVILLADKGVGALVVSRDGQSIDGIVSERDVVRSLAKGGASAALTNPVSSIMTAEVLTCAPSDRVGHLMGLMTEHRIRHIPVAVDGRLGGIISIGDVVKCRLAELKDEAKLMEEYIHHGR